ncbi:VOC family protein [Actinoplanes sp. NPDC049265]|uniref:VOC family protein n=1 Tax=Actinoplanes sp. NPDC049265 TaxID=3363902 RepID=UPI00372333CD
MDLRFTHDHVGITLAAEHLEATIAWYRHTLDFVVLDRFEAAGSNFTFIGNGDSTIELISAGARPHPAPLAESLPASHDTERLHHFCLAVTDLDATVSELKRREVPIFAGPMTIDRIGRRIAFVRDNVGTVIELTQPLPSDS